MTYHSHTFTQQHWIQKSLQAFTQWIQTKNQHELDTLNLLCQHSQDILSSFDDIQAGRLVPVEVVLDELNTYRAR